MKENAFQFLYPAWLVAGLVLVVLGFLLFRMADGRRKVDLGKLAHPRFQGRLIAGWSPVLRWVRRGLWLGAVFSLTIAAARPQFGYEWREVKRRGIDILFAVDTSRSMLAEDLVPNRLERSRLGILDFLERLEGDRVGLVPFAGSAFALCPLTLDYDAFRESLNSISTDLIPRQGTDLASAIYEADRLFDVEGNNQRFLVLITDGEDLQGEAVAAAKKAAKNGTTIYTVGVGAAGGQLIPVQDRFGRNSFLKDDSGQNVETKLDEEALIEIAELTGGIYVPLGRGAEGLDGIYQKRLALAPKSELAQKLEKIPLERFQWPLGVALMMLALQAIVGERRGEKKRKALVSVARRVRPVVRPVVGILMVALVSSVAVRADEVAAYNDGTEAYEGGDYKGAAEKLEASLATADLDLQQRSYYNLGNSLFRMGEEALAEDPKEAIEVWEKSLKAYDDSLALNESDEDARFSREFVEAKLEELKKQEGGDEEQDQEEGDQEEGDSENSDSQGEDGEGEQSESGDGQEGKDGEGEESADSKPRDEESAKDGEGEEESGEEGAEEEAEEEAEESKKGLQGQEEKQGEEEREGEEEGGDEQSGEAEGADGEASEPGDSGEGAAAGQAGGERKEGEMSREEAIRLLDGLAADERVVIPVPTEQEAGRDKNTTKGKTW